MNLLRAIKKIFRKPHDTTLKTEGFVTVYEVNKTSYYPLSFKLIIDDNYNQRYFKVSRILYDRMLHYKTGKYHYRTKSSLKYDFIIRDKTDLLTFKEVLLTENMFLNKDDAINKVNSNILEEIERSNKPSCSCCVPNTSNRRST